MLTEISEKMGPYARDQLTHASNVIDSDFVYATKIRFKILDENEEN